MSENNSSRRNFLKTTSLASAGLLAIPQIVSAAYNGEANKKKKVTISKDDVILFQGDSITDAGRKKDDAAVNTVSALGNGYALLALLICCLNMLIRI